MTYTCTFCGGVFSSKKVLIKHQRRATYCLEMQGLEIKRYKCKCGNEYALKDSLSRHEKKCGINPQPLVQNESLQGILAKCEILFKDIVSKKGDTPRNVMLNSMEAITDDRLKNCAGQLTMDYILKGAKGYADFFKVYPLKDNAICTDRARKKIKYKNEHGEISDDLRLLSKRFFQAIAERNKKLLKDAYQVVQKQVEEIAINNRAGDIDITGLLTKAITLQDILIKSENAAAGEDEEFIQEFINHLAKII